MRRALQVTCINDALFPDTGRGHGHTAAPTRSRRGIPGGPDLLRAADGQHRLPRGGAGAAAPSSRRSVGTTPSSRRPGPAPGRLDRTRSWRALRRRVRDGRRRRDGTARFELTEFLVDQLGVTDAGASFPHRVTYHPTCRSGSVLATGHGCCSSRSVGGPRRPARRGGVLRFRRNLCDEERRHVNRHGGLTRPDTSGRPARRLLVAGDNSCLMHIGGLLSRQRSGVRTMTPCWSGGHRGRGGALMGATFHGTHDSPPRPRWRPGPQQGAPAAPRSAVRDSRPPMCIRHELSPATRISAPVSRDVSGLVRPHGD